MKSRYSHFYRNTEAKRKRRRVEKKKSFEKSKRQIFSVGLLMICSVLVFGAVIASCVHFYHQMKPKAVEVQQPVQKEPDPLIGVAAMFPELPISEEFLTVNAYSRPGLALTTSPQYIVIHYTANPGSTAMQNRNYFENLKDSGQTYASAQFVIGLEGEIIQCVPCNEMAYCSNSYNEFCISIEMCHPDDTGNFNDATYNNCVYLVAKLMNYYNLDMDHLIRHYDITGKNCPKYFVEHDDRWLVFKDFVKQYREQYQNEEK